MEVKVICLFDLRHGDSPHLMRYFGERLKRCVLRRGEIFENTTTPSKAAAAYLTNSVFSSLKAPGAVSIFYHT